jgi:hypothetical protein
MRTVHLILPALLLVCSTSLSTERAHAVLIENKNNIVQASRSFGIPPRLLASIVYAEHSLNVNLGEDILDKVLALSGYNSSIGVAQVKVETALWIRRQLDDASGIFFDPARVSSLKKQSSGDIIEDLSEPKVDLIYAAAYVRMILKVWNPLFALPSYKDRVSGLVATIYSLGLSHPDGSLRLPHADARMNHFGEVAQSFFDSFELTNEFPK